MNGAGSEARTRFYAILAGQVVGVLVILVVGLFPFTSGNPGTAFGLTMLKYAVIGLLAVTVFGWLLAFVPAKRAREFEHENVSRMLRVFVRGDLLGLLFLVCQAGGLSRTMFLPVFFLIPLAYRVVEEPSQSIKRTYWLIGVITAYVLTCFAMSHFVTVQGGTSLPLAFFSLPITDFTLDPRGYNISFLLVSLLSLSIPAAQMRVLRGHI